MANQIKAPINYPVIAGGKIVAGGSVLFGQPNVKPDEDNPSTLKAVYLDAALTQPAQNPQGLSSDGVFDQSDTGILFGSNDTVYSIVIKGANKKELSYIPEYDLSDANAAATAQDAAAAAASSEANALSFKNLTEALYTDFTNRYFGPFSSDPSVDDLGNPPNEGSIYFNSTSNVFFTWNGSAWINYFPSNPNGLLVTATGTTTPRTLGDRSADVVNLADESSLQSALIKANSTSKVLLHNVEAIQIRVPTDLPTLQEAVDTAYNITPKVPIDINIDSGHLISSGILLTSGDYSNITITSIDSTVTVHGSFTDDAIMRVDNANAPNWGIFVNCNSIANRGLYYTNQSKGLILAGCGIESTKERGLYVNDSRVHADFCKILTTGQDGTSFGRALWVTRCATLVCESAEVSSVNPDTTIYISRNSKVHAASITATSIGGAVLLSAQRGSIYNGQTGTYSGSSSVMFNSIRGANIVINDSLCTNIGARGLFADGAGASIHANGCTLTGAVGNTDNAIEAIQGGEVSAQSLIINGVFDSGIFTDRLGRVECNIPTITGMTSFGVRAVNMGQVVVTSGTVSGSGVNDLRIEHGSQICARSTTTTNGVGTPDITDTNLSFGSFNSIDGVNGIIWN